MKMSTNARVVLAPLGVPVSEDGKKICLRGKHRESRLKKILKRFPIQSDLKHGVL